MDNIIIIVVILAVIVLALLRTKKHFKGGGCCGSGSTSVRSHKKLTEPQIGEKVLTVEGMHCENCQNRVEHALNRMDGVVCKVNLRKKTATVSYSKEVSEAVLKKAVADMGYQVTEIR